MSKTRKSAETVGGAVALILALFVALCFMSNAQAHNNVNTYHAEVIRVVDGDTMDMRIDMGLGMILEDRIRVLGFNAPETFRPRNEAERAHGKEATKRASELLQGHLTVVVSGRGSFGRVLARIILEDGTDFSETMISGGLEKRGQYGKI
jgi:endonuclease YncB( thermonuclease family)